MYALRSRTQILVKLSFYVKCYRLWHKYTMTSYSLVIWIPYSNWYSSMTTTIAATKKLSEMKQNGEEEEEIRDKAVCWHHIRTHKFIHFKSSSVSPVLIEFEIVRVNSRGWNWPRKKLLMINWNTRLYSHDNQSQTNAHSTCLFPQFHRFFPCFCASVLNRFAIPFRYF